MPILKKEILRTLQTVEKPIKRADLLFHLRGLGFQVTDRELRSTIEEMIVKDQVNIESSHLGYGLIKTEVDLNRAMEYLNLKAKSIAIRKNCLLRNWTNKVQTDKKQFQPTLF